MCERERWKRAHGGRERVGWRESGMEREGEIDRERQERE